MFGPRHTIESVAKKLIDGLDQGTVILPREESPQIDIENVELVMRSALARSRRQQAALIALGLVAAAVGICIAITQVITPPDASPGTGALQYRWPVLLLLSLIGMVIGFLCSLKAGERAAELKTFIHIYNLADQSTARRLAQREAPRLLRERELQAVAD